MASTIKILLLFCLGITLAKTRSSDTLYMFTSELDWLEGQLRSYVVNYIRWGLPCYVANRWALLYAQHIPRCSSITRYHSEQTNGYLKWCVYDDGTPIEHTLDMIQKFPYNCDKARACPKDTVYEKTQRCEASCDEALSSRLFKMTFHCKNKCICARGMYRNKDGKCVKKKDCKSAIHSCEKPKIYKKCATRCPATCATPKPGYCIKECNENMHCVCPPNMVQYSQNNRTCTRLEDCPKCEHDSLPSDCAPDCPDTCPDNISCKGSDCQEGVYCVCPPGTVRLNRLLPVKCVSLDKCPPLCESPRVAMGCGTACPATCDDPEPTCEEKCTPANICSCPVGYLQRSKTDKTCVRLADCLSCKGVSFPVECTPECPPSCTYGGEINVSCKRTCKSKYVCGCPKGYVHLNVNDDECVKLVDCPDCNFYIVVSAYRKTSMPCNFCLFLACKSPAMHIRCTDECPATCAEKPDDCIVKCKSKYTCGCPIGWIQLSLDDHECVKEGACPRTCEEPKVYEICPSLCQPTCKNPDPKGCQFGCNRRKCICPKGMVQPDEMDHSCIKPAECSSKTEECKAPAVRMKCKTRCPATCGEKPWPCTVECKSEYTCGCPSGYIQLSLDKKECVKEGKCPRTCDAPKVYQVCPSMCQPTCDNPEPPGCRLGCNHIKCICPEGMVQPDERNRTCIKPSECPGKQEACEAPAIRVKCTKECPATCEQKPSPCSIDCNSEYTCGCPVGYIQLSLDNKKCVKEGQCPKVCEAPKVFEKCPSLCQPTCEIPEPPEGCQRGCNPRNCVCPEGMVQPDAKTFTCIKKSECARKPICKPPKVFAECASKCPPTCAEPDPFLCSRACDANILCVCPYGMVQHDKVNRTCIAENDCPVCKSPKVFVDCASKCRPTCQTPNPTFCDKACDPDVQCVCPAGMVHPTSGDDSCIPLSECPESCEFPLVATNCASKCPPTCKDPVPSCPKGCKSGVQCECSIGLLQISDSDKKCVFPSQCPGLKNDCPLRKQPTRCASGCPATCENKTPRFCTKPCRPDVNCECPRGMVQKSLKDDTCVWPDQCDS
ncbi:zonadhesin-like isoform X3 [Styela clava]